MHSASRERSIQSQLKHVYNLKDHSLPSICAFIDDCFFNKELSPSYIENILHTLRDRSQVDKEIIKKAIKHLKKQTHLMNSCYLAYHKGKNEAYDNKGQLLTFNRVLGSHWENLFHKKQLRELRLLTPEEAEQILHYIEKVIKFTEWEYYTPPHDQNSLSELYLMLRIMNCNGARKNEVYQINDQAVIEELLAKNVVTIHGKTKASQNFYVDDQTLHLIQIYVKKFGFPIFKSVARTHNNVYVQVLKELQLYGVIKPELRSWRNLFAYRASESNQSLGQEILNHNNPKMTAYYANKIQKSEKTNKISFLNSLANSNK